MSEYVGAIGLGLALPNFLILCWVLWRINVADGYVKRLQYEWAERKLARARARYVRKYGAEIQEVAPGMILVPHLVNRHRRERRFFKKFTGKVLTPSH